MCLVAGSLSAQAPTGSVSGTVLDQSGALVSGASVTVVNRATGVKRSTVTTPEGAFGFASLQAGSYEVKVEAVGFRSLLTVVSVETGLISTVEAKLEVGKQADLVTVEGAAPQVEYESHAVQGVVTRSYIDSLPLNGRSFLQLAQVQPGVTVSAGALGQYNRQFDVNVLGSGSESVRITVDGAAVNDSVTGGTQQNFSQDVVEEFQVSMVNFDLSTGITGSGAVNVVTRGGSNDFHGNAYFYFRDHNMSAYPFLRRDPLQPDPYFSRSQPGVTMGGPIKKNKLFFFGSYEHNNQRRAVSVLPSNSEFAAFASNSTSPYNGSLVGGRVDYRISDKHSAFFRYSHDGNNGYAPSGDGEQPSHWAVNTNYADSGVFSLVSSFSPTLVNEFRYSSTYWDNTKNPPTASVCPAPCFGLGGPEYNIYGIDNFTIGVDAGNTPQSRKLTRSIFADNFTWQRGSHRWKMGGEWEYQRGTGTYAYAEPGSVTLFSPDIVRFYNSQVPAPLRLSLPSSFKTLQDVLSLPVAGFAMGIGDINQPPSFQSGNADHNNRLHVYLQDTWRVNQKLTLNFGLAWSFESNLLNHDITKPKLLAPLLGQGGLGAENRANKNFTPMIGFAWSPSAKTVIRGGGGIYYDTMNLEVRLLERAAIGPLGTGRVLLYDSAFLSAILPVAFPSQWRAFLPPLNSLSSRPTPFTGALFQQMLPALRAGAAQQLHSNPDNTDLSIRNIDVFKQAPGLDMFVQDFRTPYSEHASLGIQRQLTSQMAISADFVFRQFMHERIRNTDLNRFDSVGGPIIPRCTAEQAANPLAQCSTGRMDFNVSGARSHYKGLLVKLDKRFSNRLQFTVSYALQSRVGVNGLVNMGNWFRSWGPQMGHQVLNVAGVYDLPWGFQISMITAFQSRGPFQPFINGYDLDGNGTNSFPLPGDGFNQYGLNKSQSDLRTDVDRYNTTIAGTPTPRDPSRRFPRVSLPSSYDFGMPFNSTDFRLTKNIRLGERFTLRLCGEVFNAFNIANLGGYSNDLTNPSFGQPTTRASNIFGSGGPRAFQFGGRLIF